MSFRFDEESKTREREALQQSSPTRPPEHGGRSNGGDGIRRGDHSDSEEEQQRSSRRNGKEKGKSRADTPAHVYVSASASDWGSESEGGSEYERNRDHQHGYGRHQKHGQSDAAHARGRTPGPDFEPSHTANYVTYGSSSRRQLSRSRR